MFTIDDYNTIGVWMHMEEDLTLTDEEIRQIIIRQRRKKLRKKRVRRRITTLVVIVGAIILVTGLYLNRGALNIPGITRGTIFIDPGHGGNDPGAQADGRNEKDDTLTLALSVKRKLTRKGFKVYMSRTTDVQVDRDSIGSMANEKNADLMVSIHRNKAEDTSAKGIEVWIPSSNDEVSRALGNNVMSELVDEGFQERLVRAGTLVDSTQDYPENGNSDMPSCLVEVGFISNSSDNSLFDTNLNGNAEAIADAIEKTYEDYIEEDK
jgi:N-acetylmuramoyl-L-alanine amidase